MATFEVSPAIELESEDDKHGLIRHITDDSIAKFKRSAWSQRRGAFVFGILKQGHVTPWYVGMAKGQYFDPEAVAPDKLRKYGIAMFGRTGTPVLTLVAAPINGPGDSIKNLETLLIWVAQAENSLLVNERKISSSPKKILGLVSNIRIKGVLNSPPGPPSEAAKAFRNMMGL